MLAITSDSTGRRSTASLDCPSNKAPISSSILSDEESDHIIAKCGVVEGKFYHGRLNCAPGNLETVKCIHFNELH